jgi:four helix bundle protein
LGKGKVKERPNNKIKSYRDLEVYQKTYDASVEVMKNIVPKLPDSEKYDLKDQLSRACKAIPRLIAEGYAKRHQKKGFQKYLDDAMAECNETVVCLSQCRDIYSRYVDIKLCTKLVEIYDIAGRQLYRLEEAWSRFKGKNRPTT